jgi:alkanesulfonate monooxygenase SsuD/methylene tetrahydromethanopterin reductase-like flavin-dependent oxidoreductase (luciferase family)
MTTIQFGWTLPGGPRNNIAQDAFLSLLGEGFKIIDGHFDSVWLTDHLQYEARAILEGWTTLTYFTGLYPHFNFGHTVLSQSFRNPALLAKMAATLQYVSRGRFILGMGTGWKEDEYQAYGYNFPSAGVRIEQLEEALQIIKALWHQEQVAFQGKHYHVTNAYCEPKPDPYPPILVGGSKPRILRVIARHADWWNVSWTGISSYRPQVQECEQACYEVGRDPKTLRRTWFGPCICSATEAKVRELNAKQISTDQGFIGTPGQVIEQMQQFIDVGVNYFMFNCLDFPNLTTLALLVNEVLPTLNRNN